MKPLDAELALMYCRQARDSITRVAGIIPESPTSEVDHDQIDRALFCVREIERRIENATARAPA